VKLLFLAPYPPYPPRGGGQQRMYQFVRRAAQHHQIWLLTFSPSPAATQALDPLRSLCEVITAPPPPHTSGKRLRTLLASPLPDMALRGRSPLFRRALDDLLRRTPFDIVQAESIEMAQYGRPPGPDPAAPLYVYDAFNAEYLLQRRAFVTDLRQPRKLPIALYSLIQWRKLHHYETQLGQRCAGALAVSADDAAALRRLAPRLPVAVVPNGVDADYFRRDAVTEPAPAATPYVLFTGTLDFRPNIDAVTWFARHALPLVQAALPATRFVVVGRNAAPEVLACAQLPGVQIVGEVEDVRPWFHSAAAYVVPMRIGGGVRLKVLEAFAMEQAVVATTMGVEGIEGFTAGEHALLADQPAAFAAHVIALLRDPDQGRRLGARARTLALRYDWQAIVPRMIETWQSWRQTERRTGRPAPP
jgi:sugar transferase (PEP-CTERM/EpsH1 system associated)